MSLALEHEKQGLRAHCVPLSPALAMHRLCALLQAARGEVGVTAPEFEFAAGDAATLLQGDLTANHFTNTLDKATADAIAHLGGGFSVVLDNYDAYDNEEDAESMARLLSSRPRVKALLDEGSWCTALETTLDGNLNLVRSCTSCSPFCEPSLACFAAAADAPNRAALQRRQGTVEGARGGARSCATGCACFNRRVDRDESTHRTRFDSTVLASTAALVGST